MKLSAKKINTNGKFYIAAACLVVASVATAVTAHIITKNIYLKQFEGIKVTDKEYVDSYMKYDELERKGHDPLKEMEVYEIAQAAIGKLCKLNNEHDYYAIGRGFTHTSVVDVEVRNALIYKDKKAMQESISYADKFKLFACVARRDYQDIEGAAPRIKANKTDYNHISKDVDVIVDWSKSTKSTFNSLEDYSNVSGMIPSDSLLYVINKESVLTETITDLDHETKQPHKGHSYARRNNDDTITIYMDLHNEKSVANYRKRIAFLSGNEVVYFNYAKLTFTTDINLNLINSYVEEKYAVSQLGMEIPTEGKLRTKFYRNNIIDYPNEDQSIDYTKYRFEI